MERVERIDGEKYHLNRLTEDELNGIRAHTIARVSQALHDVEIIETELALRRPEQQTALVDSGFTSDGNYVAAWSNI